MIALARRLFAVRPAAERTARPAHRGRGPRAARGRARAAVLWGAAAVVAAHAWLAVAVETTRPQWRDPEFFHRQQRAAKVARWEAKQGHARPLVVVLGSSRPEMGFSPEHLGLGTGPTDPLVFNCSQSGCRPVGLRLNLARVLAANPRPDFVLVEVLPALLADRQPTEDWLPAHRLGRADVARLRPYLTNPDRVGRVWAAARLRSWHSLRLTLQPHWFGPGLVPAARRDDFLWSEMRFFGWSPFYPAEWPDAARTARTDAARGGYAPQLTTAFQIAPVPDRAYRDLLAECRDRGVRAALFLMPESPTFRSWYAAGVRERAADYLAELSREFAVPVFDGSEWEPDERAYSDAHHLLGPGAERFSARLGRECVGPWVRGAAGGGR